MILRLGVAVWLALLAHCSGALAQTPVLQGPQLWLGDREVGEGAGVRTGDFEFHPGISTEFGYDSNFFQRADSDVDSQQFGPAAGALRLRVLPYISLRTLDRRLDAKGRASPRTFAFEAGGQVSYNELIGLAGAGPEYSDSRNLQGGLAANLSLFPKHKWSADAHGGYRYAFDPSNQGGLTASFSRHLFDLSGALRWQPGGGAFEWNLIGYSTQISLYDQVVGFDNQQHHFTSDGRWRFLPKTAVVFDANFGFVRYALTSNLNDGNFVQARLGLSGLVGTRFGLMALLGWATSFYANQNGVARNYDDFVTNLEGRFYLTTGAEKKQEGYANVGASSLTAGYSRTFQDGYLSDYFRRDRLYGKFDYLIGGVVLTRISAGVSFIGYPDFQIEGNLNDGFSETRLDLVGFAEYRIRPTIGLNLTLQYDQNASQVVSGVTYDDDLSFQRFIAMIGARWFL